MARFLLGDELGHIKSLRYAPDASQDKTSLKVIHDATQASCRIECGLTYNPQVKLTAAFSNGSTVHPLSTWNEPRLKEKQKFVGLSASARNVLSCTSNGALRMVTLPEQNLDTSSTSSRTATLPMRLRDWKLSEDETKFIYGGDEVDVSMWSTELSFQSPEESKKRKRNDSLFPAELWRAKNVANDGLGLRQPVRISSLIFLDSTPSATHLLAGTELGDARRYDTRAGRRPVTEFNAIGRIGGVNVMKKGMNENEVFIGDNGSNLFSVDLRNGKIAYGYKGLSGSVNSIALASGILATAAQDRFARIHSVHPLPELAGQRQDQRGQVLEKVFTRSLPSSIVWDGHSPTLFSHPNDDDDDEDVWRSMQHIGDDSEVEEHAPSKHRRRRS
ncbi:hypothetical protein F5887DRAFT_1269500 [Amanita rubescens]|nr:hypothetical protein F5887DRAFT_1269500 [Amanita rubescens]